MLKFISREVSTLGNMITNTSGSRFIHRSTKWNWLITRKHLLFYVVCCWGWPKGRVTTHTWVIFWPLRIVPVRKKIILCIDHESLPMLYWKSVLLAYCQKNHIDLARLERPSLPPFLPPPLSPLPPRPPAQPPPSLPPYLPSPTPRGKQKNNHIILSYENNKMKSISVMKAPQSFSGLTMWLSSKAHSLSTQNPWVWSPNP